jgi:hypothetical protein
MKREFLPLSKSWAIRMIFLDMLYGKKTGHKVINYFRKQSKNDLSNDINAAMRCAENYLSGKNVYNVGNAGTVCRFIIYVMFGKKRKLRMGEQLRERFKKRKELENLPKDLTGLPLTKLMGLRTSQYASAAILMGMQPILGLHPKCDLTIEARQAYFANDGKWIPRYDEVIIGQLRHFLYGEKIKDPIAEDYCHLRAFNLMDHAEGKKRWPELAEHESNRLAVMEKICKKGFDGLVNTHNDHGVFMAVVLRQISLGLKVRVTHKRCVRKSYPVFLNWIKQNT